MKSIKELLPIKKVPALIHICQLFGFRGYSNLKKEGIINLIVENIKNPQFKEDLQYLIPNNGTTALILKSLIENKNQIIYKQLRKVVLQERSSSTFRENYRKLLARYIIFEDEESDNDLIFLPKEYTETAKKIVNKKIREISTEEIVEEDDDEELKGKKEIKTIDQLLYSKKYSTIDDLQLVLMSHDLKISGTKIELVERMLYDSNEPIEVIIEYLMSKNDLKDICRDFGLAVSSTKDQLLERILEKLPPAFPEKAFKQSSLETQKVVVNIGDLAEPQIQGFSSTEVNVPVIESREHVKEMKVIKEINLKKDLFDLLNQAHLDYRTLSNTKTVAGQIFGLIKNIHLLKQEFRNLDINRDSKEQVISVKDGDDDLAISVWYFDKHKSPGSQKQKIAFNIMSYKERFGKNLICYIYDPAGKLSNEDINMFKANARIIHKNERNFKGIS